MKRILPLCSLAAAFNLVACGAFKEEADKVGDGVDLQGRYQTETKTELSIRSDGIGCVVHDMDVTATDMTIKQVAYADKDCKGAALGEIVTEGGFDIGHELGIAPGARELNFTISKVTITPHSGKWLSILDIDGSGECNVGQIPVNETREVTGMKCGVLGQLPRHDAIFFTSFVINGDELKFTRLPHELPDNVGTKDEAAPRAQDLVVVYHRK